MKKAAKTDGQLQFSRSPRKLEQCGRKLRIRAELLELIAHGRTSIGKLCAAFGIKGAHVNVDWFLKFGYTWVISEERALALLTYAQRQPPAPGNGSHAAAPYPVDSDVRLQLRDRLRLLIKIKHISIYKACLELNLRFRDTCGFLTNSPPPGSPCLSVEEILKLLNYAEKYNVKSRFTCGASETRQWTEGIRHDLAAMALMNARGMHDSLCWVASAAAEKALKLHLGSAGGDLNDYFTICRLPALYDLCRDANGEFDRSGLVREALMRLTLSKQLLRDINTAEQAQAAGLVVTACIGFVELLLECTPGCTLEPGAAMRSQGSGGASAGRSAAGAAPESCGTENLTSRESLGRAISM